MFCLLMTLMDSLRVLFALAMFLDLEIRFSCHLLSKLQNLGGQRYGNYINIYVNAIFSTFLFISYAVLMKTVFWLFFIKVIESLIPVHYRKWSNHFWLHVRWKCRSCAYLCRSCIDFSHAHCIWKGSIESCCISFLFLVRSITKWFGPIYCRYSSSLILSQQDLGNLPCVCSRA